MRVSPPPVLLLETACDALTGAASRPGGDAGRAPAAVWEDRQYLPQRDVDETWRGLASLIESLTPLPVVEEASEMAIERERDARDAPLGSETRGLLPWPMTKTFDRRVANSRSSVSRTVTCASERGRERARGPGQRGGLESHADTAKQKTHNVVAAEVALAVNDGADTALVTAASEHDEL